MDPQIEAIETIDRSVAVNAGAGTGKTKVLTERFVYILENGDLEEGKEVESIVAITFTKKATQEMIERIRAEIRKNFYKGNKWTRFYRDMEKANISTIHSFCGKILRENPMEAKVDPLFDVLDESKSIGLLNNSIVEAINIGLNDKNLYDFILLLNEFKIENLTNDICDLYNNIRTVGLSFEEVKKLSLDYIDSLTIQKEDLKIIKDNIVYLQGKLTKRSKIVKLVDDPIWVKFKDDEYQEEEIFEILEYLKSNLGTSKNEADRIEVIENTIARVLLCKEKLYRWAYICLLDLLIEIDQVYTNKKSEISSFDYDDLQLKVLRLLDNKDIREKYQNKFKYIMIDEFQDTNEVQKSIFYKLSSRDRILDLNNLFVVGDPKQSIYGFRGADIDVFYQVLDDVEKTTGEKCITLSKNYRTVNTVMDFINDIFEKLMLGKYEPLDPFHTSENKIDIEILENPEFEAGTEDSIKYEANLIAKRIRKLVEDKEYRYGDIALLFRATTKNHYYEEAMRKYNIPYYNTSSRQFFKKQEILDMINALKSISNPYDLISTIGFFRGPMINLSDETIFFILRNKKTTLYNVLGDYIMSESDNLAYEELEKVKNAKKILDYFYSIKDICNPSYLLNKLIEKTYFIEGQLLKIDGKQAVANIYKFVDLLEKFEGENRASLEEFIDYIDLLKDKFESEGIINSEDSNVVNLLTIHKSKGLQFPVVIIPEMARDIRSIYPRFLFSKDMGLGIKTDENRAIYDLIRLDKDKREKEESKRVLYVAMTRAKEMLIIAGQGNNKGFKAMIGEKLNPDYFREIREVDISIKESQKIRKVTHRCSNEDDKDYIPLIQVKKLPTQKIERFNISQYLEFKKCKRSYYLNHYKKFNLTETIEVDAIQFDEVDNNDKSYFSSINKGNIIHKFCELYEFDMDKKEILTKISRDYNILLNDEAYIELEPYINNYTKYIQSKEYDKVYKEKQFYISLDNGYISGIIDRINILNNRIEIVDIKTNRLKDKEELIKYYEPQLIFYAYAVEKVLGQRVNKASILFLENGEEVDIDLSEESMDTLITDVIEFIRFVQGNSEIKDFLPSKECYNNCKNRNLCRKMNAIS